jgi:hypothetical protein
MEIELEGVWRSKPQLILISLNPMEIWTILRSSPAYKLCGLVDRDLLQIVTYNGNSKMHMSGEYSYLSSVQSQFH